MNANLIEVDSIDRLESLFVESHKMPVVIFKHSTTCGISAGVLREVSSVDGDIHMIVMQTHRPLSNAIEPPSPAAELRRVCPCAGCVNEWTGEKTLDAATIPDDLSFKHISIV